jgi:hypothetical protein
MKKRKIKMGESCEMELTPEMIRLYRETRVNTKVLALFFICVIMVMCTCFAILQRQFIILLIILPLVVLPLHILAYSKELRIKMTESIIERQKMYFGKVVSLEKIQYKPTVNKLQMIVPTWALRSYVYFEERPLYTDGYMRYDLILNTEGIQTFLFKFFSEGACKRFLAEVEVFYSEKLVEDRT